MRHKVNNEEVILQTQVHIYMVQDIHKSRLSSEKLECIHNKKHVSVHDKNRARAESQKITSYENGPRKVSKSWVPIATSVLLLYSIIA
jgi:hypothetical protein